ncbi:S8 family serine peptidase [Hyalangium minutum]|uniref:Cold-active serine alkaline protease n=1 Tax=Hyalangium minutum TaxID=394096 RepID=A0A085WJU9_9BACT|nr:S8 family serine peptidase [Hyalangium minutum]KFE67962.1 Cold-active serine alkaline protease [Hyalangium minutum]
MTNLKMIGAVLALSACTSEVSEESQQVGAQESPLAAEAPKRVIVNFKAGANKANVLRELKGKELLAIHGMNASAMELPAQALAALDKNPAVEFWEEDAPRKMLAQSTPFGIDMVQAPLVWPSATGANRKICIIDSGLYTAHEDHQSGKAITGYPTGWNADKCHHGTHVAGTIAAVNNSVGVVGVLPNGVNLHIIKVFGDDCAWTYSSTLADAANRCVSAGANVISMSLGGATKSKTEETAFNNAWSAGLISVAAAGNDGTNRLSYPASYANVISVGAVDSTKTIATFSQFNSAVDVSAPGVGVQSTVGALDLNTLVVGGTTYSGGYVDGAARSAGVTGTLVNGGLCDSVGAWAGKVVLCQRGTIAFVDKVNNVKAGGGVAAALYNNVAGGFAGTLGDGVTSTIPAISLSLEDGNAIIAAGGIGQAATAASSFTEPASGYDFYDGTSMATPHVSAVAALVWSYNTSWTNARVRKALEMTAEDRGTAGRDNYYGYGIVRAKNALDYAIANP